MTKTKNGKLRTRLVLGSVIFSFVLCGYGCSGESVGVSERTAGGYGSYMVGNSYSDTKAKGAVDDIGVEDTYTEDAEADSGADAPEDNGNTLETGVIDTEKLVYNGEITIDTLKFDETVEEVKKLIEDVDGFIEYENVWDDAGSYYYDDFALYNSRNEQSRHTYNARVRVPSASYTKFVEKSEGIGDVRSQSSNVQNITQEYSTTKSQLEIYETKYKRYLELMEQASTVEEMIEIEREITNIEVSMAQYKTALSVMDTDVAYSTMDVTVNEIIKSSDIKNKNTFLTRLKETAEESWYGVLDFLEWVLFAIIRYWWYVAFAIILYKLNKKFRVIKGIKLPKLRLFRKKVKQEEVPAENKEIDNGKEV